MDMRQILCANATSLKAAVQFRADTDVRAERTSKTELTLQQKRKYPYRGFVDVEVAGLSPFVMFCNNDDPVALQYFWHGRDAWEPGSVLLWSILCEGARGAVIDVGAFSGLYSLVAHTSGCREVVAFEPSRMPVARLLDNINANGASTINVVPKAVSDFEGTTSFGLARGLRTLSTAGRLVKDESGGLQEPVMVGTIDNELSHFDIARVSLVKIDVEGSELNVVRGMVRTIDKHAPDILIEIRPEFVLDTVEFFNRLGYNGWRVLENDATLVDIDRSFVNLSNYFFTKNETSRRLLSGRMLR